MPINLNKMGLALDRDQAERARGAAVVAPPVAPDQMARALQHSKATGVPPLVVAENLQDFDKQAELDAIEAAARANPGLAALFLQPENVALAKDDLPNLAAYGDLGRVDTMSPYTGGDRMKGLQAERALLQERGLLGDHRSVQQFASDFGLQFRMATRATQTGLLQLPVDAVNFANSRLNKLAVALAGVFGQTPSSTIPMLDPLRGLRESNAELDAQDMARLSLEAKYAAEAADLSVAEAGKRGVLAEAGQTVAERVRNPGLLVGDAGMIAGSMAGVTGPMTRAPAAVQIALGAAGQAGATSADVQTALEGKGVDPQEARRAAAEASLAALGIGLLLPHAVPGGDSFEKWAAGQVGRRLVPGEVARSNAVKFALPLAGEMVSEGGEEASIQAVTNLYSGNPLGQGVGSAGALGTMGGVMMGTVPAIAEAAHRSYMAAAERDYVDNAVSRAQQSKLRQVAPDRFEAYAESLHPGATVYIPADAVAALYQSEVAPAVADLTGSPQAWDEALATGELAIPLSRYVTQLAEQHATLGDRIRLQPGESLNEPVLPDRETVLADIEKAMAEAEQSTARDIGPAGEVYDALYGQLLGVYGDATAAQHAAVGQAFYRTLGERTGLDPLALWQRFPLDIAGPQGKQGPRRKGLDIAMDPLIDAALSGRNFTDGDIFGGTLAAHVIALGGINPESVGGGDLRAMDALKRPGLLNLSGMTVEMMAETLADNGWRNTFSQQDEFGRPDYRELIDLLAQDLGGSPVYERSGGVSDPVRVDKRQAFREQVDVVAGAFREYAMKTGTDPATLPREEQRRIVEEAFATLEQPAYHGTPHTVDRFSLQKIGTGEGAQAYGWGIYFASLRDVAREYQRGLSNRDGKVSRVGGKEIGILHMELQRDKAWEKASIIESLIAHGDVARVREEAAEEGISQEAMDWFERDVLPNYQSAGNLYRVEVPEDSDLLDWDKPLSEQPEKVRAAIAPEIAAWRNDAAEAPAGWGDLGDPDKVEGVITGSLIYQRLARELGPQGASHRMLELGIPGLRYLDGGSRAKGEGSANYVIWDENAISEPQALYQSAQPFYSALAQSIEAGKGAPKKGTAEQWKGWLDGAQRRGEFKQAERDWLGVDEWLAQQDGPVSREALADFIRANEVRIDEVTLGQDDETTVQARIDAINAEYESIMEANGGWQPIENLPQKDRARIEELTREHDRLADVDMSVARNSYLSPKFDSYQLPGGENYRELLLTLPERQETLPMTPDEFSGAMLGKYGRGWMMRLDSLSAEDRALFDAQSGAESRNLHRRNGEGAFRSSHFDQPNILAHVRFNERTDADGKRVLFIEEIQSDWHQAGRKRGYAEAADNAPDQPMFAVSDAELVSENEWSWIVSLGGVERHVGKADYEYRGGLQRALEDVVGMVNADRRQQNLSRARRAAEAVPDAPFKATDEWAMLAFKRMVRHAAENGFDRIAWTTGEQQAERYDLSKQIDSVTYDPLNKRLVATKDRQRVLDETVPPEKLDDYIGKDVASKLLSDDTLNGAGNHVLSGLDLRTGGSGMRGFYDKILPSAVNKWAKKFGGKVGDARITTLPADQRAQDADLLRQLDVDVGDVAGDKRVAVHSLTLTPAMRDAALSGLPLFQDGGKGPRAEVLIPAPDAQGRRPIRVNLFAGKDRSSFMHEAGHAFIEIMGDLAAEPGASQQVVDDFHAALRFMQAPGATDAERAAWWRSQPIDVRREAHERWARGFEAYLREGNAPSGALRAAFARFKVWLTNLYRTLRQLDIELTDDVRGVFDRMLATDAEIAQARKAQYQDGLIAESMAAEVMDPEDFEAYHAAVEAARADAEAALSAEVLREEERAQKAFLGGERRKVRAEVEAATRALPAYRALRILRSGRMPDGAEVPQALRIKLDKEALLDDYGKSFIRHLSGTYAVKGGVHPDVAASLLGFASGRELVETLVNAPALQEVIAADTDRIMRERYPDPMLDGTLAERAMLAVHRERQADVMLLEVNALERHIGAKVQTQAAVLKEVARKMLAKKPVRALRPATYRAAEAKWGKAAFEAAAKQDWEGAASARRLQLLNHLLFAEAARTVTEAQAAQTYLKRFTKKKRRAQIGKAGGDFLEQIDGILERFDLRPMSGPAMDRRARLADWIKAKAADDIHVDLPPTVLDEAFRLPWAELTVAQMRQVRDSVKHLVHLSDLKNKLLLNGQMRDRRAVDAEVAGSVLENGGRMSDAPGERPLAEKLAQEWGWVRATLGAATDMARRLDGYADLGPVWTHTVGVIRDAINNRVNPELEKAAETVAGLYRANYSTPELRQLTQARKVAGVRGLWSREMVLALALNWGNEGNRQAVLTQERGRLTPEEVGLLLGTLSERDWTFVQGAWKAIDAYWPAIAESQRRRKGLVPEKVEASPFSVTTVDGKILTLPGSYYPLKYEADSTRSRREQEEEFYDSIKTGRFVTASTKDGHTLERVGSAGKSVRLDLNVLDSHMRDVIRDLYLGDAVNYVHQVMKGSEVSSALGATNNLEIAHGLELWLRDVATGEIGLRNSAEKAARFVRQNFTAAVLTWKFVSAALQITGLVQTSVVLGKGAVVDGAVRYSRRPIAMTRYVTGASPFMRARVGSNIEVVQQVLDARSGRIKTAHGKMIRGGYWMIGRVQQVVDVITWLGAEAKGMEMFQGDVQKARAYADDVVSRAQGSGEFMDKTAMQRGTLGDTMRQSEWIRAATALQGYMITKHNAVVERTAKARKEMDGWSARSVWAGMKWAGDMSLLLTVEAVVVAAIRGGLPDDDDDDGTSVDDWIAFLGSQTASNLLGGIPGLGSMVTEMRGYDAKGIVPQAWAAVAQAKEQVSQGEVDKALAKASVKAAGYATGIPSSQINYTLDALAKKMDGKDVQPYEYVAGPKKD